MADEKSTLDNSDVPVSQSSEIKHISTPVRSSTANASCAPIDSTPRRQAVQGVHNSPFREWAKSNLSNFDNEIFSPSRVDRTLMSPPYSHAVKIESPVIHAACKEEIEQHDQIDSSPQRHSHATYSSPFSRNLSRNFAEERTIDDDKSLNVTKDSMDFEHVTASKASPVGMLTPIAPQARRAKLEICDLFSFELVNGKISACGFEPVIVSASANFQRSGARRPPLPSVPATPGFSESGSKEDGKLRTCSCKKSRCLKLYCECFAASEPCKGCKCVDCANDGLHEGEKEEAVERIKQRSINAFAPKIEETLTDRTIGMHARGCRCKKSHCLKKYCECFQGGVKCGDNCKCEECQNLPEGGFTPDGSRDTARSSSAGAAESPSPRSKKARMLDFNLTVPSPAATPLYLSRLAVPTALDQETPEKRTEAYPAYLMLGSPSCLLLPN